MRDNSLSSTAHGAPLAPGQTAARKQHKYLHAEAAEGEGAPRSRWLAPGSGLRCGRLRRAVPLWALALGTAVGGGLAARPVPAQGMEQPAGAVSMPSCSLVVGAVYPIDVPNLSNFKAEMEAGTGVVSVSDGSSGKQRQAIVRAVRDGVARVDVTWIDGSVHSYRITVGSGKPQAFAMAPASTSSLGATENPLSASGDMGGSVLPSGNPRLGPHEEPSLSGSQPIPARGSNLFPIAPWTRQQPQVAPQRGRESGRDIHVRVGLARFLRFSQNILSVYFSDPSVMDARALNARSVAVTGSARGNSTLAVSVAQSPNDTLGRVEIFNIIVDPATPSLSPTLDAATTEAAIQAAIYDPRILVGVFRAADGTLAASLKGTLHDVAEKSAAESTAALFVPRVSSYLYVDPFAPTLSQAMYPIAPSAPVSGEGVLQSKLRQITGNETIELVSLPGTLAVKATVDSPEDAEALLSLLPTLNTRVQPFIVVRGQNSGQSSGSVGADGAPVAGSALGSASGGKYYGADRPILNGEDLEITRRLQEVTGIRTVSVVRTAQNALAIYGTVRNRVDYETVRRYVIMLPVIGSGSGGASQSRTFSNGAGAGALPTGGQSVGGAGGANVNRPQFNPALQGNPGDPFFQSQAQIGGGAGGGAGAGGAGTGAVAPAAPSADGFGTGAGSGTGAVAPAAPNTGGAPGSFGTGTFGAPGANNFGGVGLVPGVGYGGFQNGGFQNGSTDFTQTASAQGAGGASQAAGFTSPETALRDPINASQQPNSGYRQNVNVQMFVRILDAADQSVRRVTLDSNIVEISRTSLRNLGIEAGTVALLSENVTPATPGTAPTITINPATGQQTITPGTPGTPAITNRTVDPTLRQGVFTAATGFVGLQGLRALDPLRFRLNALYQSGNARILSRPNLSAVEGAEAQIVVGGERPVPSAVATGQAVGQSIVFRRFGIILTMRPTMLDDDTILLQIRADVTELASEYGININGALVPGERVRSVNTTITVRPGDTFVLGGLITNDRRQQTSRIPILSSLPFIGSLFKSKRFENNESELAIFMTPRIDKLPVTVNGRETVNRASALPPLPDSATGTSAFGAFGTSTTR